MICIRCKASIIGSPPDHLVTTRLCPKCYRVYLVEQELKNKESGKKETEVEQKEVIDEGIENRFDILDI